MTFHYPRRFVFSVDAVGPNVGPAVVGSIWAKCRVLPKVGFEQLGADHVDVIGDGDEIGEVEAGDDGLAGLTIDEAQGDDLLSVDDSSADVDVAIGPDFQFLQGSPPIDNVDYGTIGDVSGDASGETA